MERQNHKTASLTSGFSSLSSLTAIQSCPSIGWLVGRSVSPKKTGKLHFHALVSVHISSICKEKDREYAYNIGTYQVYRWQSSQHDTLKPLSHPLNIVKITKL